MTGDKISIFLRDCQVQLRVGVHKHEQTDAQPVIVNLEAHTTVTDRFDNPAESGLSRVVDYDAIHHFIRNDLPQMGHICLLESLAERIIAFCFRDIRIHSITVRLEKPDIFANAIPGISMTRSRAAT